MRCCFSLLPFLTASAPSRRWCQGTRVHLGKIFHLQVSTRVLRENFNWRQWCRKIFGSCQGWLLAENINSTGVPCVYILSCTKHSVWICRISIVYCLLVFVKRLTKLWLEFFTWYIYRKSNWIGKKQKQKQKRFVDFFRLFTLLDIYFSFLALFSPQ